MHSNFDHWRVVLWIYRRVSIYDCSISRVNFDTRKKKTLRNSVANCWQIKSNKLAIDYIPQHKKVPTQQQPKISFWTSKVCVNQKTISTRWNIAHLYTILIGKYLLIWIPICNSKMKKSWHVWIVINVNNNYYLNKQFICSENYKTNSNLCL